MAQTGLTSQSAQLQLFAELQRFMSRTKKVHWLREIIRPPFHLLTSVLVVLASLFLAVDFAVGTREVAVIFQAVLLLILASLNISLFVWEVYILKTRRIRHLLSNLEPLLNLPCPWTPQSYPATPVATLRGHFTIPAFRDGALVNLPTSLLVKGDIIQLYHGIPTPANVALLDPSNNQTDIDFMAGEVLPRELFKGEHESVPSSKIKFVEEAKALRFVVTETPILPLLETTITKKQPKTLLTQEKNFVELVLNVLVAIVYLVSMVIDTIRGLSLVDDFSGSGAELLLRIPTYTVLPLLHLPLPIVWTIVNLYGTARIILLIERGPLFFQGGTVIRRLETSCETFKQMLKLLFRSSKYPNYRSFHILGNLTSCCAVDQEYILTSGSPTPEKVFFLRCTKAMEESASAEMEGSQDGNTGTSTGDERGESESQINMVVATLETYDFVRRSSISEDQASEMTSTEESREQKSDDEEEVFDLQNAVVKLETMTEAPDNKEQNLVANRTTELSLGTKPEVKSTGSTISDAVPFEIVTEILDLSPSVDRASGLCFDDINFGIYISSLKPIGVNLLATSHFLRDQIHWYPSGSCIELQNYLNMTSCACPLGMEIGVTEYLTNQFEQKLLLYSVGNPPDDIERSTLGRRSSVSFFSSAQIMQQHVISVVLCEDSSTNCFLMSRGSGAMIASCCSDFWDGKDLQPMTELERGTILDFFKRRNLISYCVALAYNPLLELNTSSLKNRMYKMIVPSSHDFNNTSGIFQQVSESNVEYTAEQIFGNLQCNQVFLGMVSFQFRPKHDVVFLIEDLEVAGIRFVHFTAENEVRGKVFAEKLGLEAGWNCHISLAPAQDDDSISVESDKELGCDISTSSTSSSLSSVYNAFHSYSRAKLPKGVDRIRPHIKNVDNVPLLVPLFTDCSTDTIQEMIKILQENSEVVLCIGNAFNRDNLVVFSQANISLGLIPEYAESPDCPMKELGTPKSSQPSFADYNTWPSPLEMAAYLNSTTCQLSFGRDSDVSIHSLVTESRHILSCIRRGLLFALGSSLSLAVMMLLASLLFLPPPLDGSHLFWFLLLVVPSITLSFLSSPVDSQIKKQMPDRKRHVWNEKRLFLFNFAMTFLPSILICVLVFGLTLREICALQGPYTDCHPLLGNRNLSNNSAWNGWRSEYQQGLLFSQDLVALFFTLYLVALSIRYIHRTEPLWKLWKFVSWRYIVVVVGSIVLQLTYFVISQSIAIQARRLPQVAFISSVPFYVWIIGILWPLFLVPLQELLKHRYKTAFVNVQRHQRLEFETKLGMNSPF